MNPLQTKPGVAITLIGVLCGLSTPVRAQEPTSDPKADVLVCAQAFEQAQVLRNQAKYLAATQEVLKCSQPKCGQALFAECSNLYAEFQQAMPSVVLSASDGKGNELAEVRVLIDGEITIEQIDGRPINLDPGNHTFKFMAPEFSAVAKRATLRAGERFRPVSAVFAQTQAETEAESSALPAQAAARTLPEPRPRRISTASYVLGGVGVAAAGGFIALQLMGSNDYDRLERDCSPDCSEASVDGARQKYALSYVSLGVSAAALAGAVGIYLLQPRRASATVETALIVSPGPRGASAQIVTRF